MANVDDGISEEVEPSIVGLDVANEGDNVREELVCGPNSNNIVFSSIAIYSLLKREGADYVAENLNLKNQAAFIVGVVNNADQSVIKMLIMRHYVFLVR